MAKEIDDEVENVNEEQVTSDGQLGAEKSDKGSRREAAPVKMSIRDAIKDGFAKAEERIENDEKKEAPKEKVEKRSDGADKRQKQSKEDVLAAVSSDTSEQDDNTDDGELDNKEVEKPKSKPPVGWTKEAKAKWGELPQEIQESVLKREKEVADGFAGTKAAQDRVKELDNVITPQRRQAIQQFGVTEAQTISKLFEWMEALSHPNEDYRVQAAKILTQNFKVPLEKLVPQQQGTTQQNSQQPNAQQTTQGAVDNPNPPGWAQSLIAKQMEHDQALRNQREDAARQFVTNWAKDKPHFAKVRTEMFGLLQSGSIPLKNGEIDLDAAYNKAIRTDDEIWNTIQEEKEEAKQAEAAKVVAKKAADIAKAKKAAVSIRPTAPTGNLNGAKASGKQKGPAQSVRDSIMAAVQEARE